MKKLLVFLFSIFFLSSSSVFADDISDFEIEGISIGDSLLDYMTEEVILEEIERNKHDYSYLNEPDKYAEVYLRIDFPTYDYLSFMIRNKGTNKYITNKNENEKYTILSVRGIIRYNEDFDSCIQKRDEIVESLSMMFPNAIKDEWFQSHSGDPSGNSIIDAISLLFDSGDYVQVHCSNWEETFRIKNNYSEGLSIAIRSKEMDSWLTDRK